MLALPVSTRWALPQGYNRLLFSLECVRHGETSEHPHQILRAGDEVSKAPGGLDPGYD